MTAAKKATKKAAKKVTKTTTTKKTSRKQEIVEKLAVNAEQIQATEPSVIVLSDSELTAVRNAVHSTYEAIGSDAGLKANARPADILEVVLDADRVQQYGRLSTELYGKFDAWLTQEFKAAKSSGAALRNLVPVLWEAKAPKQVADIAVVVTAEVVEAAKTSKAAKKSGKKAIAEVLQVAREEFKAKESAKATKAAQREAAKAAKKAATVAKAQAADHSHLPLDPTTPEGADTKPCPKCGAVAILRKYRQCSGCWNGILAERAAAKRGASGVAVN